MVLIALNVTGALEAVNPPEIGQLIAQSKDIEASGALDRTNAMKARLFLDGQMAPEGRITGPARDLFLDMNGLALRAAPFGSDVDSPPFYSRLAEIAVPTLVVWGNLDFPHVQERCRHIVLALPAAKAREVQGATHLPSLESPNEVTAMIVECLAQHADAGAASLESRSAMRNDCFPPPTVIAVPGRKPAVTGAGVWLSVRPRVTPRLDRHVRQTKNRRTDGAIPLMDVAPACPKAALTLDSGRDPSLSR